MNFVNHLKAFNKLFGYNENLLRLLYYPTDTSLPVNPLDPSLPWLTPHFLADGKTLDTSHEFVGVNKYVDIRNNLVVPMRQYNNLTSSDFNNRQICRLSFYLGQRRNTRNYLLASQELVCDIYVHKNYEQLDMRMEKICDYMSDSLFNERPTGIGKVNEVGGSPIPLPTSSQYFGYQLIYDFGSSK